MGREPSSFDITDFNIDELMNHAAWEVEHPTQSSHALPSFMTKGDSHLTNKTQKTAAFA